MVTFVLYHNIYTTLALCKWTEFYRVILFIIFLFILTSTLPSYYCRDNYVKLVNIKNVKIK